MGLTRRLRGAPRSLGGLVGWAMIHCNACTMTSGSSRPHHDAVPLRRSNLFTANAYTYRAIAERDPIAAK